MQLARATTATAFRPPLVVPLVSANSTPAKSVESLIRVADERQVHLGDVLLAQLLDLHAVHVAVVVLVDFVGGEVAAVDVGREAGLEGGADFA